VADAREAGGVASLTGPDGLLSGLVAQILETALVSNSMIIWATTPMTADQRVRATPLTAVLRRDRISTSDLQRLSVSDRSWLRNVWRSIFCTVGRPGKVFFLLVCTLSLTAFGCSFQDWGDDHLVLNELELLEPNDLWVELREVSAEPIDCSFARCQNVLRVVAYEVIGDFDMARVAALDELMETWVQTSDDMDPLTADLIEFQLRENIEIDTSTGTAYMRLGFDERAQVSADEFRPVIDIAVSSDPAI